MFQGRWKKMVDNEKLLARKAQLEMLLERYEGIFAHWRQKQDEAGQQVKEWATKMFSARERLAEYDEIFPKNDAEEEK